MSLISSHQNLRICAFQPPSALWKGRASTQEVRTLCALDGSARESWVIRPVVLERRCGQVGDGTLAFWDSCDVPTFSSTAVQSLEDEPTQVFPCLPQEPGPSHLSLPTPGTRKSLDPQPCILSYFSLHILHMLSC